MLGLAALEQGVPVAVDLCLVLAAHEDRDRVVEGVELARAEREELLRGQGELDLLDAPRRSSRVSAGIVKLPSTRESGKIET